MSFVRAPMPIWAFIDPITGLALNDSYYVSFLTNVFSYVPQNVFHDNQGLVAWANPLQLTSAGELPNNLYFDPTEVYRIEVRNGPTQSDQLIYEVNDFVATTSGSPTPNSASSQENQITNPQFSQINFVSPLTITSSGTTNIAPGWNLVLTGSGSTTVTQIINSGSQNTVGSNIPPYALRISSSGWSTVTLQQTFNGVGAIWYNNFVSMSLVARSNDSNNYPITMNYVPNSPGIPPPENVSGTAPTGSPFQLIQGVIALTPPSINTTPNNTAFVNINITLPALGVVDISNIQVIGQETAISVPFPVQPDETIERQTDHLFHYYSNQLINYPKESILTGWSFSLNPYQFVTSASNPAVAQTQYIADQTIIHQRTAANTINSGMGTAAQRFGLFVQAINGQTSNQFALIQYIDPSDIRPYWGYRVSSMVRAAIFTSHSTQVSIKMRLIYRTSLPSSISNTEPIASWSSGGDPVFAAGWTIIKPLNDPTYLLVNKNGDSDTTFPPVTFDAFQLPSDSNVNQTLGIVVYTINDMNQSLGTEDTIVWDRISLVPNDFAVDSPPEQYNQVLKDCQFFYEKSYIPQVFVGAVTTAGQRFSPAPLATLTADILCLRSFQIHYMTQKRVTNPTISLYSPASALPNLVQMGIRNNGSFTSGPTNVDSTKWTATTITDAVALFTPNTTGDIGTATTDQNNEGIINYHYAVSALLGA